MLCKIAITEHLTKNTIINNANDGYIIIKIC